MEIDIIFVEFHIIDHELNNLILDSIFNELHCIKIKGKIIHFF